MTQQLLSNLRDTAELFALKNTLAYHGLDADDLLTRFFSKLKARNIDCVFEIETFLSVANKMVTANIKTTNGTVGLQVYTPRNKSGSFEIKLVDVKTQATELLFIMQSNKSTEAVQPSD